MPSARQLQWAKIRISVVILAALSVLVVLVYLLSGGTWLKPKIFLTTYLPDSTGLAPGSPVLLNGVHIGKVDGLRLTRSKDRNRTVEARLKVELEFLRRIPEDSLTGIDSATMIGDKYLDITMGRSPRPIRPGSELAFRPPSTLVQNIDIEQLGTQLRAIDQIIRDIQEGKGSLGAFVVTDQMYRDVVSGVIKVEKNMRAATNAESQLGQVLYGTTAYDRISASVRQLDDRLAQFQASPYLRNTSQYDQVRTQIAQARQALTDLLAGQGAGGKLLVSDAAYADWNRRLKTWIESVDALNYGEGGIGHMLTSAEAYESLQGSLHQLAATVKEFREDPQKFLRIKIF